MIIQLIFIETKREQLADAISAELKESRGRLGSSCFINTVCMQSHTGERWKPPLFRALKEAKLVVVLITQALVDSLKRADKHPSYVLREIYVANFMRKKLFPVVVKPLDKTVLSFLQSPPFRIPALDVAKGVIDAGFDVPASTSEHMVCDILAPLMKQQAEIIDPSRLDQPDINRIAERCVELLPKLLAFTPQRVMALGYYVGNNDGSNAIEWVGSATLVGWHNTEVNHETMVLLTCTHVMQSVPEASLFTAAPQRRFNLAVGTLSKEGFAGDAPQPEPQPEFVVTDVLAALPSGWEFGQASFLLLYVLRATHPG